jgi:2'-5' RNA ligase
MMQLLALDVALLPPPDVQQRAIGINAALPAAGSQGLQLDEEHRPHVTLTQAFIRPEELHAALDKVNKVLKGQRPFTVEVTGPRGHHRAGVRRARRTADGDPAGAAVLCLYRSPHPGDAD